MLSLEQIRTKLQDISSNEFTSPETRKLVESVWEYLVMVAKDPTLEKRLSNDWRERVLGEYLSLKDKTEKLHKTLIKWDAGTVVPQCNTPIEVLQTQYKHMTNYLNTLEVRMELEGINY